MDIKQQAIHEYLHEGVGYRTLAKKYGVSRTTINKWVMVPQGIHNLPPTENQQKYYLSPVKNKNKNQSAASDEEILAMQEKIALLEKQLQWEKMRADALDTMINVAEKQLDISIRKKPGAQQSEK
jgi:transposase-like protein